MTLGEFGLTSREQIYEKADELKRGIDEKTEKIRALTDEIPTLILISNQYIDNREKI